MRERIRAHDSTREIVELYEVSRGAVKKKEKEENEKKDSPTNTCSLRFASARRKLDAESLKRSRVTVAMSRMINADDEIKGDSASTSLTRSRSGIITEQGGALGR